MTDSSLIEDLGCWLTTDRFCGLFQKDYGSWQWLSHPWLRTWGVDWLLTDSVICFRRTMVPGNDRLLLDWGPGCWLTTDWFLFCFRGTMVPGNDVSSLIEDLGCWLTTDWFCGLFQEDYGSWQWLTPPSLRTWGVDWQSNWLILLSVLGGLWFLAMTDSSLIEDLTHLVGPLTEETVVRCLQAKFYSQRFQVCLSHILNV